MLIDSYTSDWLDGLDSIAQAYGHSGHTYLLLDGAFVPGIHKRFAQALPADGTLKFLFEDLPGWRNEVRDVSPFVIRYDRANTRLKQVLNECSGWPMISAICTPELFDPFASRLSRWCVVNAAGQYINLRFPDTRRLPDIYSVLSDEQRTDMFGLAVLCAYVGRDGKWNRNELAAGDQASDKQPELTAAQFDALVNCSEADSVLAQIGPRSAVAKVVGKSKQYITVCAAIALAKERKLKRRDLLSWCEFSLEQSGSNEALPGLFQAWHSELTSNQIG